MTEEALKRFCVIFTEGGVSRTRCRPAKKQDSLNLQEAKGGVPFKEKGTIPQNTCQSKGELYLRGKSDFKERKFAVPTAKSEKK